MGRPLKIAKAQAILTLTDTDAAGDYVTVSQNLSQPTVANPEYAGVIAGMPFVPASSIGGLVGGTTYWVLRVLSTTTFTVSATPLDANPTLTPVNLSAAGPVTVSLTVGVVDSGFNNPTGSANTYSVVGGNTGIYGPQVLAQVAIGINGTGTLYTPLAVNTSNVVVGVGTDLANLSTGAAVQIAVANINGSTNYVDLGFASATHGNVSVAVANTTVLGSVIGTSGNAQTLIVSMPIQFDANFGGLTTSTTYFVKTIANAAAFTVSTSQGGPVQAVTANASVVANALMNRVVLTANANVVGSNAAFVYANDEAGYIVRQKGKQKYLVTGSTSGLTSQCFTANVANTALTPNTMRILATYANSATQTVQSLSDHTGELFTATSGPIATGNIVFGNATPIFATFNTAIAANAANAQPYPIVTIDNA
jgi:hypothetical protein